MTERNDNVRELRRCDMHMRFRAPCSERARWTCACDTCNRAWHEGRLDCVTYSCDGCKEACEKSHQAVYACHVQWALMGTAS